MIKIVYFDEGSATDYLTIKNGGSLVIENEKTKEKKHSESLQAGVGIKSLFDFLFLKGDSKANLNMELSNAGAGLIKTTISNTILSDFLEIISDKKNSDEILELSGYKVYTVENSIAYFQTITPYLRMAEGNVHVDDDFNFKINEIHDTFKFGKGYYELLAIDKLNKDSKKIFRFNNNAFKNNYSISDLEQMDFIYYGVKVGSMKEQDLHFSNIFNDEKEVAISLDLLENNELNSNELDVYDVILAGVK